MGSIKFFFKILFFTFVIAIVIAAVFFAGDLRNSIFGAVSKQAGSVKGASTQRAQEVTGQIGSDIAEGFTVAKNQVLNLRVKDALQVLSRAQKIPQDVHVMENYVKEQIGNFLNKK